MGVVKSPEKGGANGLGGDTVIKLLSKIALGVGILAAFYEAIGPILGTLIKFLGAVLLVLLRPFLEKGADFFRDMAPKIIDIADNVAAFLDKALGGDKRAKDFMSSEFKSLSALDQIAAIFFDLLSLKFESIKGLFDTWGKNIDDLLNRGFIDNVIKFVDDVGVALGLIINGVAGIVNDFLGDIGIALGLIIKGFGDVWAWFTSEFGKAFTSFMNTLISIINKVLDTIRSIPIIGGSVPAPFKPISFSNQNFTPANFSPIGGGQSANITQNFSIQAGVDREILMKFAREIAQGQKSGLSRSGVLGGNFNG